MIRQHRYVKAGLTGIDDVSRPGRLLWNKIRP